MKKRILSMLMAVVMLVSVMPSMGAFAKKGQVFHDIKPDTWYAKFVYPLSEAGIVSGTDDTHYKGGSNLRRAEFLILLSNSVMDISEFDAYKNLHICPDADNSNGVPQWYAGYLNWAAQEGIIPRGEKFRPMDNILRWEAAELTYAVHKAHPEAIPLTPVKEAADFADKAEIPESTMEALTACNRADVINGDTAGRFLPNKTLSRGEGATMMCKMLGIEPWDESRIPVPPRFEAPKTGSAYGASYVEFDPQCFDAKIALAGGRLDSAASSSSILKDKNAYIAVDGAMFDDDSTKRTWGSFVSGGKVLRIMRPDTSGVRREAAFVIDTSGKASIQWMNVNQSFTRISADGTRSKTIESVGVNTSVGTNDGSRMVYTRDFATKVSGKVAYAFAIDNNDTITKVYLNASDVPVPASGYLLFTRKARDAWTDRFFTLAQEGDKMERGFKYSGSTVQNVQTLISCGPTVLKNGSIFTNYTSEGNYDSHVLGSGTHMLIGVKSNGRVVIACASGSQQQMGQIMKNLGCKDAMNLDGGASTYLNCNGKQIASPGRQLTNMLYFTRK